MRQRGVMLRGAQLRLGPGEPLPHRQALALRGLIATLGIVTLSLPAAAVPICEWGSGDTAIVCTSGPPTTCETTQYLVYSCHDSGDTPDENVPIPENVARIAGRFQNNNDDNKNGVIDEWGGVVDTTDTCSKNFDRNDRLGTNHGGSNNIRPNHTGDDIQANLGDPVASMKAGQVLAQGWNVGGSGCGIAVRIGHYDGSEAIYCHLQDERVFTGQHLPAGHQIGRADSTGNSSGHHLHVTYFDSAGNRREYFNYVDQGPTGSQLNPNGC